jgi:ABC-type nitrate/sulfonate/bicarbonate transport system permease component
MAIHPLHHIGLYKKRKHRLMALVTLLIPIGIICIIGIGTRSQMLAILAGLGISFYRLILGYIISLIVGIMVAIPLGTSKWGDTFTPVLDVMQNVPSFALIPVFALFLGYTDFMAIIFIASSVVWPILFYIITALRTSKTELNDAATIFGATGWRRIIYYLIPLSFPAIITGSIVGISIGWEAVIGLEIIGYKNGIGVLLNNASVNHDQSLILAGISVLLVFVFILNRLVWLPLLNRTHSYAE